MRSTAIRMLMISAMAMGLAACGNGGDDNPAGITCRSLAPLLDGPNSETACTGTCTVDNRSAAADGNFGSKATLTMQGTASGFAAVSARARGGGMFAAGTRVSVIYEASSATQSGVSFQLNTYLAGAMQDSFVLSSDGVGSPSRATSRSGGTATRPYDTVEFRYVRGSGTTTGSASAYEFCSD